MRLVWLARLAVPGSTCARDQAAVDNPRQPRNIARGQALKRITNIGDYARKGTK
jgi:hypothetical protein